MNKIAAEQTSNDARSGADLQIAAEIAGGRGVQVELVR
jgi:hypothetical protein